MARKLYLSFILVALAACQNDVCSRHSDCAHDQTCSSRGVCVGGSEVDAGVSTPAVDAVVDANPDGGP